MGFWLPSGAEITVGYFISDYELSVFVFEILRAIGKVKIMPVTNGECDCTSRCYGVLPAIVYSCCKLRKKSSIFLNCSFFNSFLSLKIPVSFCILKLIAYLGLVT